MDTLTVEISSSEHAPRLLSVTLSQHSTVLHLKELIHHRVEPSPSVSAGLELFYNGHRLENTDTLEQLFGKLNWSASSDRIRLVASYSEQKRVPQDSEPCSPAPLRFRTGSGASVASQTAAADEVNTSGTNCNQDALSHSDDSFNKTKNNDIATVFSHGAQNAASMVPYQYAIVNGMPYLVPSSYLSLIQLQQQSPYPSLYAPGAPSQQHPANSGDRTINRQQHHDMEAPAAHGREQDHAPRDQRRAAALWLFLKLAFGVYVFSQNGSIERIALLHIAALIIFLHQTGRLRIVRRVAHPPQEGPGDPATDAGNPPPASAAPNNDGPSSPHATDGSAPSSATHSSSKPAADSRTPMKSELQSQMADDSMPNEHELSTNCPLEPQQQELTQPSTEEHDQQERDQDDEPAPNERNASQGEQQPRLSSWRHVEHALLIFITSLIPAPPPEIDPALANAVAVADDRAM